MPHLAGLSDRSIRGPGLLPSRFEFAGRLRPIGTLQVPDCFGPAPTMPTAASAEAVVKPHSDWPYPFGVAMLESEIHSLTVAQVSEALRTHFKYGPHQTDALVATNLALYYRQDDPRSKVVPDLRVAFKVARGRRSSYMIWEEGKPPDFVLEVTSPSTHRRDQTFKSRLYAAIGVQEYWLFDPSRKHLVPSLQAYRLEGASYRALEPTAFGTDEALLSDVLGVYVQATGSSLHLRDRESGLSLSGNEEAESCYQQERLLRREAEAGWEAEAQARREAEAGWDEAVRLKRVAEARSREAERRVSELEAQLKS